MPAKSGAGGGPSFAVLPFAKGGVLLFWFLSWLRPKRFLAQAQGGGTP
jgi:hypothetical protein